MDFVRDCTEGDFEIVKKNLEKRDIHIYFKKLAFRGACCYNHIEIAKWLYEIILQENEILNIYVKNQIFRFVCRNGYYRMGKWLLTLYSYRELKNLNHILVKEELENRTKSRISLILYLFEKKFKLLDIHAIAISWREFL